MHIIPTCESENHATFIVSHVHFVHATIQPLKGILLVTIPLGFKTQPTRMYACT